jgi:hypothetical protein
MLAGKKGRCPVRACTLPPDAPELMTWCRGYAYGRTLLAFDVAKARTAKALRREFNSPAFMAAIKGLHQALGGISSTLTKELGS